jgi:hypothetical protein
MENIFVAMLVQMDILTEKHVVTKVVIAAKH